MSREICKNSSKMYHFLNKIQNLPEMNQEFSCMFYTFFKNLPEMEEKSPSFHFQTQHMYECALYESLHVAEHFAIDFMKIN